MDYPRNRNKAHMAHKPPDLNHSNSCISTTKFKYFMSEFLGTFIFVYLGQSTLTSFELLGTQNDIINRQLATIFAHGLAFLLACMLTLNLSGAHLNPSYTLASAFSGYLSWPRAFTYMFAQYSGSFIAAAFIHATYSDKLAQRHQEGLLSGMNVTLRAHGNILSTGKLFSSYPPTEVSLGQLFVSYTLATTFLMLLLLSIQRAKSISLPDYTKPVYMAAALILIRAAFAANGGPVLNPAQDFSPRLYIALFGWGSSAFNLYKFNYWWICGIIAPYLGALVGFGFHRVFAHLGRIQDKEEGRAELEYTLSRDNEF